MNDMPMTATAKKGKVGELRSIHIRKIEDGFIGSCSYEPKPGKHYEYIPDKEYALKDKAAVHEFIDDVFGEGKAKAKAEPKGDWSDAIASNRRF